MASTGVPPGAFPAGDSWTSAGRHRGRICCCQRSLASFGFRVWNRHEESGEKQSSVHVCSLILASRLGTKCWIYISYEEAKDCIYVALFQK